MSFIDFRRLARRVRPQVQPLEDRMLLSAALPTLASATTGSISGTVYNDANGNGTIDAGEGPLAGFQLFIDLNQNGRPDPGEATATSDASGHYEFDNVPAGSFTVYLVAFNDWQASNLEFADTGTLTAGAVHHHDWIVTQMSFVEGQVYSDANNDGHFEYGTDAPLVGWTVYADLNNNGRPDPGEPTAFTDDGLHYGEGVYHLILPAGSYTIRQLQQNGYTLTQPQQGTYSLTVAAGTTIYNKEFGNFIGGQVQSVSGRVFNDTNATGVNVGPPFELSGWRVYADTNSNGQFDVGEPTAVSDSQGDYTLYGLSYGTYTLREVVQPGWYPTRPADASQTVVISSNHYGGIDFGNFQYGTISGVLYNDLNADNVRQPGEPGLAGWTMFLDTNNNGQLDPGEPTALTDAGGHYVFTSLAHGEYRLHVVERAGWRTNFGGADDFISSGSNYTTDWPQIQLPQVTGVLFADLNGDKVREAGEPPLSGWTITASTSGYTTTTVSAADGTYVLEVPPATYTVTVTPIAGWHVTTLTQNSFTAPITTTAPVFQQDVGYAPNASGSISGAVFNDLNDDGLAGTGEPGMAGVSVYLDTDRNGQLDFGDPRAVTDASGHYTFTRIPTGTFAVREVLPAGFARTTPLMGSATSAIVVANQTAAGPKFGNVQISTVPMNFNFLLTLAQHYGQPGTFAAGDLNGDDQVNFDDLLILAQNYGQPISTSLAPSASILPTAASTPTAPRKRAGHLR